MLLSPPASYSLPRALLSPLRSPRPRLSAGEAKPRQVISGLVNFVPQAEMEGRRVVVVTNLKPAKLKNLMSYGMVSHATGRSITSHDSC